MAEQLAIFGGKPVRQEMIHYGRQYIDEEDIQAVVETLRSPLITCGPKVAEFEKQLCDMLGCKYAVVVSNGTAALHLAAIAAGIGPGDEVLVTPMTFAASANCILYCGATPVFADINPQTYNIDPEDMRRKITSKTKAVVAVDFCGQPVELEEIRAICEEHNLVLIEDAAHAIGSSYHGKNIGSIADFTTFSFHPVKNITCGEGGAITTNNKAYYENLMMCRTHGITRDINLMKNPTDDPWYNEQRELGYNYRMTDFQAALGLSQLKKLPAFKKRRQEIVKQYQKAFSDIPQISMQQCIEDVDVAHHLFIIKLNLELLNCNRREFFDALEAENVCPQVHYMPVYYHSYYEGLGYKKGLCPCAEELYERELSIPLYYSLTDEDVASTIAAVKKVINYYKK